MYPRFKPFLAEVKNIGAGRYHYNGLKDKSTVFLERCYCILDDAVGIAIDVGDTEVVFFGALASKMSNLLDINVYVGLIGQNNWLPLSSSHTVSCIYET